MRSKCLGAGQVALLASCVLIAQPVPAQTPPPPLRAPIPAAAPPDTVSRYRLRLLGVFDGDAGTPLSGVEVTDVQTGVNSSTNASGLVRLLFLPDGGGTVRIRKVGYTPVTTFVAISPADTAPVTELLTKSVATLPTVTTRDSSPKYISPALNDFEQRRANGFGRFISEAELRKRDNDKLADVLRTLPGAMLVYDPSTGNYYFVSSRKPCNGPVFLPSPNCSGAKQSADCYSTIYVDGVPYYLGTISNPAVSRSADTPPPDVNKIVPVSELAGVEYYASDAILPPGFTSAGNGCGTVLLWTRER